MDAFYMHRRAVGLPTFFALHQCTPCHAPAHRLAAPRRRQCLILRCPLAVQRALSSVNLARVLISTATASGEEGEGVVAPEEGEGARAPTRIPSFSALEEGGEPMRPKKEEAPATNKMCWELELQALARGLWKR
jgi:hypothetical protein